MDCDFDSVADRFEDLWASAWDAIYNGESQDVRRYISDQYERLRLYAKNPESFSDLAEEAWNYRLADGEAEALFYGREKWLDMEYSNRGERWL